jgi:hypothetical protein
MDRDELYELICEYGSMSYREGLRRDDREESDEIKFKILRRLFPAQYSMETLEAIRRTQIR